MVNFCAVYGCSNRADREKNKLFYHLPKIIEHQGEDALKLSEERRTKWLSRISQEDLKGDPKKLKQIRVCSDHFVSGKYTRVI